MSPASQHPPSTPSTPAATGDGFTVTEDVDGGRFLLHRDGELVGYAEYHHHDGSVVVPHVETLIQHRGQGYGAKLMDGLLDIVRSDDRRVTPLCGFAAGHIRDNPRLHDLLR